MKRGKTDEMNAAKNRPIRILVEPERTDQLIDWDVTALAYFHNLLPDVRYLIVLHVDVIHCLKKHRMEEYNTIYSG